MERIGRVLGGVATALIGTVVGVIFTALAVEGWQSQKHFADHLSVCLGVAVADAVALAVVAWGIAVMVGKNQ